MTQSESILFDFTDSTSAAKAFSLLQELGYDPVRHTATRLHIQVIDEDLTSALEIAQVNGGQLVKKENSQADIPLFSEAYLITNITIPAHIVNEDIVDNDEFLPSIEGVNNFSAND